MMYRIEKVLNHNTVMAIHQDDHKEVLIMGKGVGFGRKVAERIEVRPEDRLYSLQKYKERGRGKRNRKVHRTGILRSNECRARRGRKRYSGRLTVWYCSRLQTILHLQ